VPTTPAHLPQDKARELGVQPFPAAHLSTFRLGPKYLCLATDTVHRLQFRRNCKVAACRCSTGVHACMSHHVQRPPYPGAVADLGARLLPARLNDGTEWWPADAPLWRPSPEAAGLCAETFTRRRIELSTAAYCALLTSDGRLGAGAMAALHAEGRVSPVHIM
jgi:hypothetical protein